MPEFRPGRLRVSLGAVAVALALGALHSASALAGVDRTTCCQTASCTAQPRPQDEIWLVSSRGLCSCDLEKNVGLLGYWQFDREQSWTPSSLEQFLATDDPGTSTVVFLHGNRIPSCEAFTKGWTAYRRLVRCADERPVRFVIWSWPSDKVCGPVEDARIKASRTDVHAYYLAWFIQQMHADAPVSLWGHSFGARIATGALHLLGGGVLAGRQLDRPAEESPRRIHAALVAAALDHDWLLPGHRHGDALSQVERMLLVNNSCDRLLARYHMLYGRRCCQQALGYVGLPFRCLPSDQAAKVSQIDACCTVGKRHLLANYLDSPALVGRMRATLLFEGERATIEPASSGPVADARPVGEPALQLVTP